MLSCTMSFELLAGWAMKDLRWLFDLPWCPTMKSEKYMDLLFLHSLLVIEAY